MENLAESMRAAEQRFFALRDGHWIDVGWHLDNGPFYQKDGHWVKNGSHPEPHDVPPAG